MDTDNLSLDLEDATLLENKTDGVTTPDESWPKWPGYPYGSISHCFRKIFEGKINYTEFRIKHGFNPKEPKDKQDMSYVNQPEFVQAIEAYRKSRKDVDDARLLIKESYPEAFAYYKKIEQTKKAKKPRKKKTDEASRMHPDMPFKMSQLALKLERDLRASHDELFSKYGDALYMLCEAPDDRAVDVAMHEAAVSSSPPRVKKQVKSSRKKEKVEKAEKSHKKSSLKSKKRAKIESAKESFHRKKAPKKRAVVEVSEDEAPRKKKHYSSSDSSESESNNSSDNSSDSE